MEEWDDLLASKQAEKVPTVYVCDCNTTYVRVTPDKEGLCPLCGHYCFLTPEWKAHASEIQKKPSVRHTVRVTGVEYRGRKYNEQKARAAKELYMAGLTFTQVAKRLSIGVSTAHKYLNDRRGKG